MVEILVGKFCYIGFKRTDYALKNLGQLFKFADKFTYFIGGIYAFFLCDIKEERIEHHKLRNIRLC